MGQQYIRAYPARVPSRRLYWWQVVIVLLPFEEDWTIEQGTRAYFEEHS